MSLSCSCDYDQDFEPGDFIYHFPDPFDFIPFTAYRRKRCCSCGELINIGDPCIKYSRYRYPNDRIESLIKTGAELEDSLCDEPTIKIADHYHCERCGEIFLNLTDIGYECLNPAEDMRESLKEYHRLSNFKGE
jgi:hypothetical protein